MWCRFCTLKNCIPARVQSPFRGQTDRGLWTTSVLICKSLYENAKQSMRPLARQTGFSKSRVPRLTQASTRRDRSPASGFWATADGRRWLTRLLAATLYPFGLQRGGGLATLSEFCTPRRLATQVGGAPAALRRVMAVLEAARRETTGAWEQEGSADGKGRESLGAVAATCLPRRLLVCIALGRGSLVFEAVAEHRTSATWDALVETRGETWGTAGMSLGSDRAQARIKLAATGLGCRSIPAVFPLIHALGKRYAWAILGRLRHARQALHQAQARLRRCQGAKPSGAEAQQAQAVVEARAAPVPPWESVDRD